MKECEEKVAKSDDPSDCYQNVPIPSYKRYLSQVCDENDQKLRSSGHLAPF